MTVEAAPYDDRPAEFNTMKKDCTVQVTAQALELGNPAMNVAVR